MAKKDVWRPRPNMQNVLKLVPDQQSGTEREISNYLMHHSGKESVDGELNLSDPEATAASQKVKPS